MGRARARAKLRRDGGGDGGYAGVREPVVPLPTGPGGAGRKPLPGDAPGGNGGRITSPEGTPEDHGF